MTLGPGPPLWEDWLDSCNFNFYADGDHSVAWHADDEFLFPGPLQWQRGLWASGLLLHRHIHTPRTLLMVVYVSLTGMGVFAGFCGEGFTFEGFRDPGATRLVVALTHWS